VSDSRGTALVEMALVLPVLLLLLFGMLDFGKALNAWIDETHLANEAARIAAVSYCPDKTQTDCGWVAVKSCPASVSSQGPLACMAWYTHSHADDKELQAPTAGGTIARAGDAYAPRQYAARVCIWFPDLTYTAGTDCVSTCGTSPSAAPRPGDRVQVIVKVQYRWLNFLTTKIGAGALGTPIIGKASMRLEAPMAPIVTANPAATGCYPDAPAGT
jgi:TadE-like protein